MAAKRKAKAIIALASNTLLPWNFLITPPVAKQRQATKA
jgi:hypothetical protein